MHGRYLGRLRKLISSADVTISHCLQMFCARRTGVVEPLKEIRLSVLSLNMVIMMVLQIDQLQITYIYINISSTTKVRLGRRLVSTMLFAIPIEIKGEQAPQLCSAPSS